MTTLHDFGGVLEKPSDTLLGSHNVMVTALWLVCEVGPLVSNNLNYILRGLKMSHPLMINMILFINISGFLNWKIIYNMTFIVSY